MEIIEIMGGENISEACTKAVARAREIKSSVEFDFNGTRVIATASDSPADLEKKWGTDYQSAYEARINSPEYKEAERKREEKERQMESSVLVESAQTELEMRAAKEPWPRTQQQLLEYIESLTSRSHDYGTCVYAMSLAAVAAFNFVAHKLGSSGFQSSCADLDIIRRTRHLKGPFMLIKAEDALFPQYDLQARLAEAIRLWMPWIKEEAQTKLAENPEAHPKVIAHWRKLSGTANASQPGPQAPSGDKQKP
jgi:hypothetical protein